MAWQSSSRDDAHVELPKKNWEMLESQYQNTLLYVRKALLNIVIAQELPRQYINIASMLFFIKVVMS